MIAKAKKIVLCGYDGEGEYYKSDVYERNQKKPAMSEESTGISRDRASFDEEGIQIIKEYCEPKQGNDTQPPEEEKTPMTKETKEIKVSYLAHIILSMFGKKDKLKKENIIKQYDEEEGKGKRFPHIVWSQLEKAGFAESDETTVTITEDGKAAAKQDRPEKPQPQG